MIYSLKKLKRYGFVSTCLQWFPSYLENRYQFTKINNRFSSTAVVPSGVLQGSILGPILYSCKWYRGVKLKKWDNDDCWWYGTILFWGWSNRSVSLCKKGPEAIVSDYFASLKLSLDKKKMKVMYFHKNVRKKVRACFQKPILRIV